MPSGMPQQFTSPIGPVGRYPHSSRIWMCRSSSSEPAWETTNRRRRSLSVVPNLSSSLQSRLSMVLIVAAVRSLPLLPVLPRALRRLRSRSPSPSDSTRYRPPGPWWMPAYWRPLRLSTAQRPQRWSPVEGERSIPRGRRGVGGGWITRARKIPIPGRSVSIGLPKRKGIEDLEQPNPGRGAAPGQHVSHPDGPKRPGGELN